VYQHGLENVLPSPKSIGRIIIASLSAGFLVWSVQPQGLIELAIWSIIALGIYIVVLILVREPKAIDFLLMYSIFPSRAHDLIERVEIFYRGAAFGESSQSSK
jgi:hypothetical protein